MRRCILGLGQRAAGDDGVGYAVIEALRRRTLPEGLEVLYVPEPVEIVPIVRDGASIVLVDALVGTPPGAVLVLRPEDLTTAPSDPASSHGFGVRQAVELARILTPASAHVPVRVVAVTIPRPDRFRVGLTAEVEAAVPLAADRALALALEA